METVEVLNQRLIEHYGITVDTGDPIYRIVWSDDQFEHRLTNFTTDGFELLTPEVRLLPKYKQWIQHKYLLEQLVIVPEQNADELTVKRSYEPLFVYEDRHQNALPPGWEVTKIVVDSVLAAKGKTSLAKYVEDTSIEAQQKRIEAIHDELFANESPTGDALAHDGAIVVPRNYVKES